MAGLTEAGRRLKRAIAAAGLTQDALGEQLGVTRKTVGTWVRGAAPIPAERYPALAKLLGRSEHWLRTGEESPSNMLGKAPVSYGATASRPAQARQLSGLPYRVRVYLHEFLAELARLGGTEEEIAAARRLLVSPELFTWYVEGYPAEFDEDQVLMGMQGIAAFIEREVKRRAKARGKP